jgi:hypothetical protein
MTDSGNSFDEMALEILEKILKKDWESKAKDKRRKREILSQESADIKVLFKNNSFVQPITFHLQTNHVNLKQIHHHIVSVK